MLEQKDLEAIAGIVNTRVTESERLLLGEIVRTQTIFEKRIEKVEQNIEELKTYYNITRLERENTSLLLQLIEELRKDVDELKSKTA